MDTPNAIDLLFDGKLDAARTAYSQLIRAVRAFGAVREVAKRNTIFLENNSPFAGVQARKGGFDLEFRINYPIDDPRIVQKLQLSTNRYVYTVKIESESDIDAQLLLWLKDAYEMSK